MHEADNRLVAIAGGVQKPPVRLPSASSATGSTRTFASMAA
jgi:hypothetical protein